MIKVSFANQRAFWKDASGETPSSKGCSLKLDKNQENDAKHRNRSHFQNFQKRQKWFDKLNKSEIHVEICVHVCSIMYMFGVHVWCKLCTCLMYMFSNLVYMFDVHVCCTCLVYMFGRSCTCFHTNLHNFKGKLSHFDIRVHVCRTCLTDNPVHVWSELYMFSVHV